MNRAEIINRLRFIASLDMAAQSYQKLILDLAEQLDLEEARLSKDRARKLHKNSTEIPRKGAGNSTENPPSRVDDLSNTTLPKLDIKLSPSLSKPLPASSRAHGTNPRAIGTNPREVAKDPEGFAEFWAAYPKRAGNADRKPAVKAFVAALKRASFETILWGAGKYADDCKARGKIGTEYVKQARSWLNADGWTEYEFNSVQNPSGSAKVGTWADPSDPRWPALEAAYINAKGKKPPRDSKGGWTFFETTDDLRGQAA